MGDGMVRGGSAQAVSGPCFLVFCKRKLYNISIGRARSPPSLRPAGGPGQSAALHVKLPPQQTHEMLQHYEAAQLRSCFANYAMCSAFPHFSPSQQSFSPCKSIMIAIMCTMDNRADLGQVGPRDRLWGLSWAMRGVAHSKPASGPRSAVWPILQGP